MMFRRMTCLEVLLIVTLTVGVSLAQSSLSNGLVGYWSFDAGTVDGMTVKDLSGQNDGTIEGDPQLVPGVYKEALEFDGAGDQVVMEKTDAILLDNSDISIFFWFHPVDFQSRYMIGTFSSNNGRYYQAFTDDNVLRFSVDDDVIKSQVEVELEPNAWYHIGAVREKGKELRLYVDGELAATIPDQTTGSIASDETLRFGNRAAGGRDFNSMLDEVRIYSRLLSQTEMQWIMANSSGDQASGPQPGDAATDVSRDTLLAWTPGAFANSHNIYLGTDFDDIKDASRENPLDVLVSQGQAAATYDPPAALDLGQTYYWRIDEVNGAPDNTIFKGDVWSFTVEPLAYPIDNVVATASASDAGVGPENTVNGSGLDADDQHSVDAPDMWLGTGDAEPLWLQYEFDRVYKLHELWVWNYNVQFEPVLGFGVKDVTIEYSTDGAEWMVLGDFEFAQAAATPTYTANTTVDLSGVAARYLRLIVNDNWGMLPQFGLSELRFFQIPTFPREPQPDDGAADVSPDAVLSWRAGREAVMHDIYLGTSPEALALTDTVDTSDYMPPEVAFGTTYYWKVDEINEAEVPSVWEGEVWTFSTLEYVVIDDMESYDDDENRIFDTWLDGFVNETGSTVGYFDAPFAETTIVNSGGQSLPLEYVNDAAPFYSEAEYDLGSMNLDINGADTLRLFVSGQAPAFVETASGSILMNAIGNDIWGTADQFRYAYRTLTGDGSMTVRVDAIDGSPNGWVKGGVMIRQNTDAGSVNAFTAVTGGSGDGATFQWRATADTASDSSRTLTGIAPPYYARIVREGNTFTGYLSADGVEWAQQGDSSVDVAMTDPVLIGLALTSHNVNQATSVEFSNVSTTGSVSADWQMAEIGATQPEGNIPDALYVALEDTNGNVAVVTHPDANIVARSGWTEWAIPYSDLAGVNLSRAAILYIGVGDRDNPTPGGTGTIFVDDIGYGRPASATEQ